MEDERIRLKPCNDLEGASRRDNAENLELRKKDEQHITEKLMSQTNSDRNELNTWMKQEYELCYAYPSPI